METGIRLDVMREIIIDLKANTELKRIFGTTVSRCLLVAADKGDLRIELKPEVQDRMTRAEVGRFLAVLDDVIERNA